MISINRSQYPVPRDLKYIVHPNQFMFCAPNTNPAMKDPLRTNPISGARGCQWATLVVHLQQVHAILMAALRQVQFAWQPRMHALPLAPAATGHESDAISTLSAPVRFLYHKISSFIHDSHFATSHFATAHLSLAGGPSASEVYALVNDRMKKLTGPASHVTSSSGLVAW